MLIIYGQRIAVDFQLELEPYLDQFESYSLRDNKLQSCSPFRPDRHPSFAVNLDNGTWIDSGATDEYHKGHFITLLAFLRQEPTEDTCEYLLEVYSPLKKEVADLQLDLSGFSVNPAPESNKVFTPEELKQYAYRSPYLKNRNITEEVQRLFRVGYFPKRKAVAMCWCNTAGEVVNIKFRKTESKHFWYAGGQRIKRHLYGYNVFLQNPADTLCITESEIDCMRLWSEGYQAVALGTAHASELQIKLLLKANVQNIIIATDNDAAGEKCAQQLKEHLTPYFCVKRFNFVRSVAKDVSDLTSAEITSGMQSSKYSEIATLKR